MVARREHFGFALEPREPIVIGGVPASPIRRAFVFSGDLGEPDSRARYDLPPDRIQRHVTGVITDGSRP